MTLVTHLSGVTVTVCIESKTIRWSVGRTRRECQMTLSVTGLSYHKLVPLRDEEANVCVAIGAHFLA